MQPLRVLIVDDHEEFRKSLALFLKKRKNVEIAGEASGGVEAIRFAELLRPDVVFLDISMPQVGGFTAARVIKASHPETKIVFVTMHEQYRGLPEGFLEAEGVVCKSTLAEDLPGVLDTIQRLREESNA